MLTNLRQLREERNITQKELAKAVGVVQQSINRYENEDTEPELCVLKRLADYFNTSVDYIIGHTEFRSKAGAAGDYHLDSSEAELIALFRTLTDEQKACIEMTARTFAKK